MRSENFIREFLNGYNANLLFWPWRYDKFDQKNEGMHFYHSHTSIAYVILYRYVVRGNIIIIIIIINQKIYKYACWYLASNTCDIYI